MKTSSSLLLSLFAATVLTAGCASTSTPAPAPAPAATPAASPAPAGQKVKSRDGKYEGEVIGRVRAGSKFAQLQIGMSSEEVQRLLGRAPDQMHTHESGKRWIPFYFGSDVRRLQVLYKGEGCLSFTGGNAWGGGGGELIGIHHDASGACYKP